MTFSKEADETLQIDMTPLVDCIFAIILFLLVAASFQESVEQDLSISLPTQSKELKVKAPPSKPVVINIRNRPAGPEYAVEGTVYPLYDLQNYLSRAQGLNKNQSVVIRGDRNLKWDSVAGVMGLCAQVGIANVSAAVVTEEGK